MTRTIHRIVIVGGGVAGLRTAESLRGSGFTGELLGFSAEGHLPYARPPLSKTALSSPEWVATPLDTVPGVQWRLGVTATRLVLADRNVELDDGSRATFDAVVLATGARARCLPGASTGLALRTLDDAHRLRAILQRGPGHLVIAGAGLIGSEVAGAARARHWAVTVVDAGSAPLAAALGRGPARWLWEQHRVGGVRTRFGEPVVSIEQIGARQHVLLGTGAVVVGDAVVAGPGATRNTEWLGGSGLDKADGVLTDSRRRALTADGGVAGAVVAVGDIARTPATPSAEGRPLRHGHWTAAIMDVRIAASTLIGRGPLPEAPPLFWTDVYEHRIQVVGSPVGTESEPEPGPRGFCVRFRSAGALTGAVAVNWPQRLPVLRREISEVAA